jgi:hypothetical protein
VFAAVQELLDGYSEALNSLEDRIVKTRKEGDVLEAFTEKTRSGKGKRES